MFEGPGSNSRNLDGVLINVVLDGGAQNHFSSIRLVIVYAETDDLNNLVRFESLLETINLTDNISAYS